MRYSLSAAALLLALMCACTPSQERFTVNGIVTDTLAAAPGSKVYLLGAGGWDNIIDSTAVRSGKFTFKGDIDKTETYTAVLHFPGRVSTDDRFLVRFVPDSEVINIDLDYPAIVTGSPLTEAQEQLQERVVELYRERESEIGELVMNGLNAQADSLYALQMQKINDFCKSTYLQHSEDAVGLQAISILAQTLSADELEALVSQGAAFIAENSAVRDSLKNDNE